MRSASRLAASLALAAAAAAALAWILLLPGKRGDTGWTVPTASLDGALVSVRGLRFERSEIEHYLGHPLQPHTLGEAERMLLGFVDRRLLEEAAEQRGVRVSEVIDVLVGEHGGPRPVSETDLEAAYEQQRHRFDRPRQVEVAWGRVVAAGDRAAAEDAIAILRVRARLHPRPDQIPLWVPQGLQGASSGRLGPLPCDDAAQSSAGMPAAVVAAACGLSVGQLSRPVEVNDGLYIVRVLASQAPTRQSLERVRSMLRQELQAEHRSRARDLAVERLRREARVELARRELVGLLAPIPEAVAEPAGPPAMPFGRAPEAS